MSMPELQRTPAAYRRDLFLARQVVGQLRDEALETSTPFQVGNLTLDAAALDALWDGLDQVDSHFWQVELSSTTSLRAYPAPSTARP